jgi:hypothetical protein
MFCVVWRHLLWISLSVSNTNINLHPRRTFLRFLVYLEPQHLANSTGILLAYKLYACFYFQVVLHQMIQICPKIIKHVILKWQLSALPGPVACTMYLLHLLQVSIKGILNVKNIEALHFYGLHFLIIGLKCKHFVLVLIAPDCQMSLTDGTL